MLSVKEGKVWKNWSESVISEPAQFYEPKSLEQLIDIVIQSAEKDLSIRVVGAGHSFTPLVATSHVLISLDQLTGIDTIDHESKLATVWAGTRLKDLGPELFERDYAMENLGDINEQSVAGAISTGTHGTGIEFGGISTQVEGVTLLTASGDLLEISSTKNSKYFEAVRLSLGMLGIIVKVTLRVEKAYQLVGESYRLNLDECLVNLDKLQTDNRNFEFFWFPYTETVQVKTLNYVQDETMKKTGKQTFKNVVVENGLFWSLSQVSRMIPRTAKYVSAISALGVPVGKKMNDSYITYATPRLVKFNEMEYSVPAEAMGSVVKDIHHLLEKEKYNVHFPIECRYVKSDSIWLSPSYQRESAYIAIHMYKGMEYSDYFQAVEKLFQVYDGRPHWGKMHNMEYDKLKEHYPKLKDFLQIREELDPKGLFLNSYLKKLFQL